MDHSIGQILESLQKLIGLHRQLMDVVRLEREALVQAELKAIHESTLAKQGVIEMIRAAENDRLKRSPQGVSLSDLIIQIQGKDPRGAEQLRSALNTLTILIQRISEQNRDNQLLVEKSLEHVNEMKKNVLGEAVPKSNTYNPKGQRSGNTGGARLFNKEA